MGLNGQTKRRRKYLGSENGCTCGRCYRANGLTRSKREEHLSDTVWNYLFAV